MQHETLPWIAIARQSIMILETLPWIDEVHALLTALVPEIADDYRASDDPDDSEPGMMITIATDDALRVWNYQTGDNSYTGGAYGLPHWAIVYLYRDSDIGELTLDVERQLLDLVAESVS